MEQEARTRRRRSKSKKPKEKSRKQDKKTGITPEGVRARIRNACCLGVAKPPCLTSGNFFLELVSCPSLWFTESSFHWFIGLLLHFFAGLPTVCPRARKRQFALSLSLLHWMIADSLMRLLYSPLHSFIDSDSLVHRPTKSFMRGLIDSLFHWFADSLVHSLTCARILSCQVIGISTTICSFVDPPHNFKRSWLLHLKNVPMGHWFLIANSYTCIHTSIQPYIHPSIRPSIHPSIHPN